MQAAAKAAAAEAAQASDLVRNAPSSGGADAQERYYAVAHAVEERVTEQPRLLVRMLPSIALIQAVEDLDQAACHV